MIKVCVVCGGEFDGHGRAKICRSTECKSALKREERQRYITKYPRKEASLHRIRRAKKPEYRDPVSRLARERRLRIENPEKYREKNRMRRIKHHEQIRASYVKIRAALRLIKEIETNGIGALL